MAQERKRASQRPQEAAAGDPGAEPSRDPSDGRGGPENGSERLSPMDSFREAAIHLRRPFTPEAVKFKVQQDFGDAALIAPYIDARLVVERLNLLVPHLWFDDYVPLDSNFLRCDLTVDGITRRDVGQGAGKTGYSDALKRAAVKFGVGVSLYAIPKIVLKTGAQDDRQVWLVEKGSAQKKRKEITPAGDAALRNGYRVWLDKRGGAAHFGQPLDHGDVLGAIGDVEVDAGEVESAEEEPILQLLETDEANEIRRKATDLYEALVSVIGRPAYPPGQFRSGLAAAGHSLEALEEFRAGLQARLEESRSVAA